MKRVRLEVTEIIAFTPAQLVETFLSICAGIVAIAGAAAVIYKLILAAKSPQDEQNARLTSLEERVGRHDELLASDKKHLEAIEEGNRVTQKALLALLDHGIDGNNLDQLKQAKDDLQRHLIER